MFTFFLWFALAVGLILTADALVRAVLAAASRRTSEVVLDEVRRWFVLVPARDEGAHVEGTLTSVVRAAEGRAVTVGLVLDGPDDAAGDIARKLGVTVYRKEPAGPAKGALLGWMAGRAPAEMTSAGAVMLLDVGSIVPPQFFDQCRWPEGADAVQTFLAGTGDGVGEAAAASESFAQAFEDRGRETLGWNVRLRGTGTVFRPEVFTALMPRLRTQTEDLETTLLMSADGLKARLAPRGAFIRDEKPESVRSAGTQRARWIVGRWALLGVQGRAFAAVLRRSPMEGLAWLLEIPARPLSLTLPLRFVIAGVVLVVTGGHGATAIVAGVIGAIAILDVAMVMLVRPSPLASSVKLLTSWLLALALAPRAIARWMRVKRP
jgi:cellulose synthase/poly-beta-1,6-N-acetylglucosamine synthase-like glycosyltransferase